MESINVLLVSILGIFILLCCMSCKKYNYEREQFIMRHRQQQIPLVITENRVETQAETESRARSDSKPPLYDDIIS